MRARHHCLTDLALAILERVANLWANIFFRLVISPALKSMRLGTRPDIEALHREIFRADAHITRAIYKTARRLAGLPRIPCPVEKFYRPKLKTHRHIRWLFLNCHHKLQHSRRMAARMAWRWLRDSQRRERDPLCDLRGELTELTATFPPSAKGRGRWIAAQPRDGGGSHITLHRAGLRVRAPP